MTAPFKLSDFEAALVDALPQGEVREALTGRGLPHRRVEEWKWSDLRTVLARFNAQRVPLVLEGTRHPDFAAKPASEHLMPRIAAGLGGEAQGFTLEDGETLRLDFAAQAGAAHQVLEIRVPEGVTATLQEIYTASEGTFANIAVAIIVAPGATLHRIVEQDRAEGAVLVVTSEIDLAKDAAMNQTTLGFGAKLARLETHVTHAGEGASLRLDGAYVVGEGLHLDQTSLVRHTGPGGETDELFKGAARSGTGVFQGKIHVEQAAQKTGAQMQHRGLLLDEKGEIDAKPELEIYADDVVCAHGNALGAIDEDALFYMRQRGLPEATARALLTESFLAEPLDRVADETLRATLLERLRARLREVA
ncbi:MAG: SufD family Fe-S cluster assembly protein [Oceanicaulis sp.]